MPFWIFYGKALYVHTECSTFGQNQHFWRFFWNFWFFRCRKWLHVVYFVSFVSIVLSCERFPYKTIGSKKGLRQTNYFGWIPPNCTMSEANCKWGFGGEAPCGTKRSLTGVEGAAPPHGGLGAEPPARRQSCYTNKILGCHSHAFIRHI